ncbi:hypothetical protein CALCODRAFT_518508 [Calocera cornea HHB12733]|uniref:Uncharacterized protein n=1 Tax=Calocera cornea HHB12733 TaxID=1353952 RepID=A0A165EYS0_9BASI|nr:hypothetical protein CALCODRAFT_518508 [Calocera cornea HHB12733]
MDKAPQQGHGLPDGPPPDYGPPGYDEGSSRGPAPPEKGAPRTKAEEAGFTLPPHEDSADEGPDGPEYTEEEAAALWPTMPRAPPTARGDKLPLPVAVPQLTGKYDSAFVRAYCPQLQAAGVGMQEWLDFCDGLNIAIIASPPLRVVDKAGMIIGFVPYHWCMIAGAVMQASAQTAMHVLSKTLSDKYLRRANKDYFGPRGLKVRLCRTAAMRMLIGKDAPDGKQNTAMHVAGRIGMGIENVALRLPLPFAGRVIETIHAPLRPIDPRSPLGVTERRMQDLQGFVCPLDFNVPPAKSPEDILGRMNDFVVKLDNNKALKSQNKAAQKRRLLAIRQGGASAASFSSSSSSLQTRPGAPGQGSGGLPMGYQFPPMANYGVWGPPPGGEYGVATGPGHGYDPKPPAPPHAHPPSTGPPGTLPVGYQFPPMANYGVWGPPPGGEYGVAIGPGHGWDRDSRRSARRAERHAYREQKHALRQERRELKWEGRRGLISSAIGMFGGGSSQQQQQQQQVGPQRTLRDVKDDRQMLTAESRAQKAARHGRTRQGGLLAVKVKKADRLEYNQTQELLWIVVLDADKDIQIEGKEVVDSNDDVEYVDDSDWDDEIDQEEEEDEAFVKGEKERGGVHNSEEDVMTRYDD